MISIIVAKTIKNYIGKDNKLLFHISEDLKRFKEITNGHKIIMGRKTFESLPKVLDNREHIIITRDKDYKVNSNKIEISNNIEEIVEKYQNSNEEVFVIGGGEIYKQLLPYTNKLYLTIIESDIEGDTKFPLLNINDWNVVHRKRVLGEPTYSFTDLVRKTNS